MLPRILSRVVGWAKAHHLYGLEFEERGETMWTFVRTWEKGTFRRVAVDVVDRFAVDATHEVAVLGSVVAAVGSSASLVAISGGVTCGGRHVQGVLGKWVLAQTGRIPNFRPASPQALSAKGVVFRLWVIGSLFHDGIYCDATEGG